MRLMTDSRYGEFHIQTSLPPSSYTGLSQLLDNSNMLVEPVDGELSTSPVAGFQDHDPITAALEDRCILAQADTGEIVGLLTFREPEPSELPESGIERSPNVLISVLLVHREYRRSGVLRQLLAEMDSLISDRYQGAVVRTWSGNRAGLRALHGAGFSKCEQSVAREDGVDVFYYQRSLN